MLFKMSRRIPVVLLLVSFAVVLSWCFVAAGPSPHAHEEPQTKKLVSVEIRQEETFKGVATVDDLVLDDIITDFRQRIADRANQKEPYHSELGRSVTHDEVQLFDKSHVNTGKKTIDGNALGQRNYKNVEEFVALVPAIPVVPVTVIQQAPGWFDAVSWEDWLPVLVVWGVFVLFSWVTKLWKPGYIQRINEQKVALGAIGVFVVAVLVKMLWNAKEIMIILTVVSALMCFVILYYFQGKERDRLQRMRDLIAFAEELSTVIQQNDVERYLPLTKILNDQNMLVDTPNRFDTDGADKEAYKSRLVVRHFYVAMADEIIDEIKKRENRRGYITGTPGTGKSTFRNFVCWRMMNKFKEEKKSFGGTKKLGIVLHKGGNDEFILLTMDSREGNADPQAVSGCINEVRKLTSDGYVLGENLFCLSDVSLGEIRYCDKFDGGLIVFTSPNENAWGQGRKQDAFSTITMPLFEKEELCRYDPNAQFEERYIKYGGSARLVWGSDVTRSDHEKRLFEKNLEFKTIYDSLRRQTASSVVPHRLVYLNVPRDGDGKYDWHVATLQIGSRYLARKIAEEYACVLRK